LSRWFIDSGRLVTDELKHVSRAIAVDNLTAIVSNLEEIRSNLGAIEQDTGTLQENARQLQVLFIDFYEKDEMIVEGDDVSNSI